MLFRSSSQWGAFPFPTAFDANGNGPGTSATRAQSTFTGSTTLNYGLLPVAPSTTYAWATSTGTLSKSSGTGTLTQSGTCAVNSTTKFRCTGILSNTANGTMTMTLTMDAEVPNVGQTLAKYTTYTGSTGSASDFITSTTATSWVSGTGVTVQSSPAASLAVSLLNTGNARVRYTVTVRYSVTGCPSNCRQRSTTFTIPVYPPAIYVGPITSPSDSQYGWFTSNEWYRLTFYAVTPSQLPGGDGSCASTANAANCLSVTGLSGSNTTAYKQGVMILMGRALAGVNSTTTRPSSSLDAYLEGQSPSTRTYQNRVGTPTTINDRVISLN